VTSYGPNKVRARTAAIMVGTALVSAGLAVASAWVQRTISGDVALSGKVLPNLNADMPQVRAITMAIRTGSYNLVRRGTLWVMPERDNYPVAPAALATLAKSLSDLSYKSATTSDPAMFARLGVDDPSPTTDSAAVTLKGATGQLLASLYVGVKPDAVFVRKAGSNDVFEVSGTVPDLSNKALWLDLKVIDITPETIASVSGQHAGEASYDIVRRPDGGFAPVGGQANVTATTAAIALTKWAPLDVMASSALRGEAIASHTTNLRTGLSIRLSAYNERGRKWVVVSALPNADDQNEAAAKINSRTDGWAFEVSATDFADLTFSKRAIQNGPEPVAPL
jgi:hypothetical protein